MANGQTYEAGPVPAGEDEVTTAPALQTGENWQTQARGSDAAEYAIYRATAESLGWVVKSFDEWLAS